MVKKALILIVILTFGLVWVVPASAVTGNSTVSATVPSAISISVKSVTEVFNVALSLPLSLPV